MVRKFKKTKKKSMKGGGLFDAISYSNTRDPNTQTKFVEGSPLYTPKPNKPPSSQNKKPNVIQMDPIHISEDDEPKSTPTTTTISPPFTPLDQPENPLKSPEKGPLSLDPLSLEPLKLEEGQIFTATETFLGVNVTLTVKLKDVSDYHCLVDIYIMFTWPWAQGIFLSREYESLKKDKRLKEMIDAYNIPSYDTEFITGSGIFRRILYDFNGDYPQFCMKNFYLAFSDIENIKDPVINELLQYKRSIFDPNILQEIYNSFFPPDIENGELESKINTVIEVRKGTWTQIKGVDRKPKKRHCPVDFCIQVYLEIITEKKGHIKKKDKTFILKKEDNFPESLHISYFEAYDKDIDKKIEAEAKASKLLADVFRGKLERDKFQNFLMPISAFGAKKKKHKKRKHKHKKKTKHKKKKKKKTKHKKKKSKLS